MHSEHLMVEKGKMSKSVGNFYQIKDLIDMGYSPENVRYQLLSGHYRTRISFSSNKKHEGDRVINRISDFRSRLVELGVISLANGQLPAEYGTFFNKLDDIGIRLWVDINRGYQKVDAITSLRTLLSIDNFELVELNPYLTPECQRKELITEWINTWCYDSSYDKEDFHD